MTYFSKFCYLNSSCIKKVKVKNKQKKQKEAVSWYSFHHRKNLLGTKKICQLAVKVTKSKDKTDKKLTCQLSTISSASRF